MGYYFYEDVVMLGYYVEFFQCVFLEVEFCVLMISNDINVVIEIKLFIGIYLL